MQPGYGDLHVDRYLTNMSVGYMNGQYIARLIFPMVPVNYRSDLIPLYDQSHWFRHEAVELAPMEAPPIGGYEVSSESYYCRKYGLGHVIPDEQRGNTDRPFDLDRDGMEWLVDRVDALREQKFVADFWKTTVWGTDKTGTSDADFTQWDDYTNATPIQDLRLFKRTVRRLIARDPNLLVLGDLTFDVLADHPAILERIKYGATQNSPAMVTPNLIAQLLGLGQVLVGQSIYTDDPEGTAEASVTYTPYYDDDGLLLYQPPRPSLRQPAAGYTFNWTTVFGTSRYIRRRREPLSELGDLLEIFEYFDMRVTAANAGLFINDAVD
jgi:hypothetical protein